MAARYPRPAPWPMLLIGIVVLALLAAAFAIAGLPLVGTPGSSPSPSASEGDAIKITGPPGWVVVTVHSPNGRADGVVIRVSDGETVPVPTAPIRQPLPVVQG